MILNSSDPLNGNINLNQVLRVSKYEGFGRKFYEPNSGDEEKQVPIIAFALQGSNIAYHWFYEKSKTGKKMRDKDYEKIVKAK